MACRKACGFESHSGHAGDVTALVACAPEASTQKVSPGDMPNLVGHSLNHARFALDQVNGRLVDTVYRHSNTNRIDKWVVCRQRPGPGEVASGVVLVVDEDCDR
jgi:hypothetical protein